MYCFSGVFRFAFSDKIETHRGKSYSFVVIIMHTIVFHHSNNFHLETEFAHFCLNDNKYIICLHNYSNAFIIADGSYC